MLGTDGEERERLWKEGEENKEDEQIGKAQEIFGTQKSTSVLSPRVSVKLAPVTYHSLSP